MRHHKPLKPLSCDWPMHDIYQGHESAVTCPQCNNKIAKVATLSGRIAQCVAYLVAFFATFIFGGIFNDQ